MHTRSESALNIWHMLICASAGADTHFALPATESGIFEAK